MVREPLILGHEAGGRIVGVGAGIDPARIGERVALEPGVPCRQCRECKAGRYNLCPDVRFFATPPFDRTFAEYVTLAADFAHPVPDSLSDDAVGLIEPLSVDVWACAKAAVGAGSSLLISGAGPIGLMATAVARHAGARHVVVSEPNAYRRAIATAMGATLTLDPRERTLESAFTELDMVEGFDVALEMSGNPSALRAAIAAMAHGGGIAILGIPTEEISLDVNAIVFKMLTLRGIYGREMYETWYKMTVMLQSGLDITPAITHRFGFRDFEAAFAAARAGDSGKVIMEWTP